MNKIYEGNVGNYTFIMNESDVIEVWGDNLEKAETYIFISEGSIKHEKDFHQEISWWYMNNIG